MRQRAGGQAILGLHDTQIGRSDNARPSKLERHFAARLGHDHAAAFGQGRSALWAALSAVGVDGARVLVPAFTCECVVEGVIAAGAEPLFFDVDPESFEPDPGRLEDLMPQARAIILIHYFGWPSRALAPLTEAARAHGVAVVDDRAHLLSTTLRPADAQPDYVVYSLPKLLPCAAGGMLATADRDKWVASVRARDIPVRGALRRERDDLARLAGAVTQRFGWSWSPGTANGDGAPAMTRVTYGLAAVALRSLDAREQRARAVGLRVQERLARTNAPPRTRSLTDPTSAFLFFPLLLRESNAAEAIAHARSKGVHLSRAWPLHKRCSAESVPGTSHLRDHLVVWQVNLHISDAEVDDVANVLSECAQIGATQSPRLASS